MEAKIIDYSEKAIAVIGDTKEIKDSLKNFGGKYNPRLTCGAGWIFSAKKREEIEKFLANPTVEVSAPKGKSKSKSKIDTSKDLALMDEYLAEIKRHWKGDMVDYFRKKASSIIKLSNGGLMCFEKPSIETSFCFGYSLSSIDSEDFDRANNMANHARTNEQYFLDENLAAFDSKFSGLTEENWQPCLRQVIYGDDKLNIFSLRWMTHFDWQYNRNEETDFPLNDEDRKAICDAMHHERAKFEKRLHTYLKRYGLSKIKSWSYWRDA